MRTAESLTKDWNETGTNIRDAMKFASETFGKTLSEAGKTIE